MHADELDIDEALVRRLVATQLPQWAGLPRLDGPEAPGSKELVASERA